MIKSYKNVILDLNKEKKKVNQWLFEIFGFEIRTKIKFDYFENIGSLACAVPNEIYVSIEMLEYKNVLLNLYLPHELIHQYLGVKIKFKGYYSIFILEVIVEFVQYFYLKEKNIDRIYVKYLKNDILKYMQRKKIEKNESILKNIIESSINIDALFLKLGVYILIYAIDDFELLKILLKKIVYKNSDYDLNLFSEDIACVYGNKKKNEIFLLLNSPIISLVEKIVESEKHD